MLKILIVDDSVLQRSIIKKILSQLDVDILEAPQGSAALDIISKNRPDCIITDLLMPVMSGIEMMEQISKQNLRIPVVVFTADIQETTRKRCMDLGAAAFIQKPAESQALLEAVKRLMSL